MICLLNQPPKMPASYSSQWTVENFWDEYIKSENEDPIKKVESYDDSDDEKKIRSDPISIFLSKSKHSKSIQLFDLKSFYKNDKFKYENEHKRLSKALGILTSEKIDNSQEILNKTPIFYTNLLRARLQFLNKDINCSKYKNKKGCFESNPIREMFLSLLTVFLLKSTF